MAASYSSRFSKRKQVRQPPMVPFLWEDKPGMPKKDWKPETCSLPQVHPIPVKLVASVPFIWEEKPGKPLPYFSHPSSELETGLPKLLLLPPPPMFYDDSENNSNDWNVDGENNDRVAYIDEQWMVELDRDAFGFDMDDSFRFAPSVEPVVVPMVAESLIDQLTAPSSPASESGSSTSSYATGVSSLVGSSFLECLFPLVPPNSDFLEKFPYPAKSCSNEKQEPINGKNLKALAFIIN